MWQISQVSWEIVPDWGRGVVESVTGESSPDNVHMQTAALRLGWYYDYLVAHLFLTRCVCNSIGWTWTRESSFKIALLAYKSIHGLAPVYLSTYCIPVSSLPGHSHLRSAGEWKMLVPRTRTVTLGPRGFFWACPSTWNALPVPLRNFKLSLDSFKWKLKSNFFTS